MNDPDTGSTETDDEREDIGLLDDERIGGVTPLTPSDDVEGPTPTPVPDPPHTLTLFIEHKGTELRFQSGRGACDILVENSLDEEVWVFNDGLDDFAQVLLTELAVRVVRSPEGGTIDLRGKRAVPKKKKLAGGKAVASKPTVITFELPPVAGEGLYTVRGIVWGNGMVAFDIYTSNAAGEMVWAPLVGIANVLNISLPIDSANHIMRAWHALFPQATIDLRKPDAQA
jgi:hypothetical protein